MGALAHAWPYQKGNLVQYVSALGAGPLPIGELAMRLGWCDQGEKVEVSHCTNSVSSMGTVAGYKVPGQNARPHALIFWNVSIWSDHHNILV